MSTLLHPSLYQINTRIVLGELSKALGKTATLDDFPDAELDRIAALEFDWVWFLGVWQTGDKGKEISRNEPSWQKEYRALLPDFTPDDVCGSPFAIVAYQLHEDFGSIEALRRMHKRVQARGLKLMLDFVPNHTAPDHPWSRDHPEYYITATEAELAREPHNYCKTRGKVFAYGRDPYFAGWPDTIQLNYRHAGFRKAMIEVMTQISKSCDGVRCDMAMLLLPEVFKRTWGNLSDPRDGTPPVDASFWPEAIGKVRQAHPGFVFMAEVYWDLEFTLQQQGFDFTYDKRLYDRLHSGDTAGARSHLWADAEFQRKSVRFLENHDEPRAAGAFPPAKHKAAAVASFFVPGMRFFHEGQLEGRSKKASLHLGRRPKESPNKELSEFYRRLLEGLHRPEARQGAWKLLDCNQAWKDNPTHANFLAYTWSGADGPRMLVAVNYGPTQGQTQVALPFADLRGKRFMFKDLMSTARYERDGEDLFAKGLFLDMPAWGYHVFELLDL